ncbi:MAG: hypothetical protein WC838_00570 [Candidatus Margulisiibacteriota bacterium]
MEDQAKCKSIPGNGSCNTVYAMGVIGALVYYIQHAASFWYGVLGVGKAIIWPAMLVYQLLYYLKQ